MVRTRTRACSTSWMAGSTAATTPGDPRRRRRGGGGGGGHSRAGTHPESFCRRHIRPQASKHSDPAGRAYGRAPPKLIGCCPWGRGGGASFYERAMGGGYEKLPAQVCRLCANRACCRLVVPQRGVPSHASGRIPSSPMPLRFLRRKPAATPARPRAASADGGEVGGGLRGAGGGAAAAGLHGGRAGGRAQRAPLRLRLRRPPPPRGPQPLSRPRPPEGHRPLGRRPSANTARWRAILARPLARYSFPTHPRIPPRPPPSALCAARPARHGGLCH